MSIEPIGLVTLALACLCLFLDSRAALVMMLFASVFGAASALFVGAANIPPGHVFIGATALVVLGRRREALAFLQALHPDRAGFWLACLVIYGIATAFIYPRVMAGVGEIVPLGSSAFDSTGSTVPLGPVSSNLTQSIYMFANLLCFLLVAALAATPGGFRAALAGVMAYAVGNTVFALLDLATYLTGTGALMDFMRNARYTLHTEADVAGMKRIVGSFTEASVFARSTLGVLGFCGTLWLSGWRPWLTGPLTAASLGLVVMSTSSTGLAGLPVAMAILYLAALARCGVRPGARTASVVVVSLPLIALFAVLFVLTVPSVLALISGYVDTIVLSKMDTDSGVERSSWNTYAMANFWQSMGLGVGLGTIRSSSLATGFLGGVGVIGTAFYLVFLGAAFLRNPGPRGPDTRARLEVDVRSAARNGALCLLAGDLMISTSIDQGLLFYALAAVAAARPEKTAEVLPSLSQRGAFA